MPKASSPSDFTNINVNYNSGNGYYTTHTDVSNLLQISAFSSSTTPTIAEIGKIIKRVEERIDDTIKQAWKEKMENLKRNTLSKEEQKMTQQYVMVK